MNTVTPPVVNDNLDERIEAFVKHADQMTAEYWQRGGYTFAQPPRHRADKLSDKWVRVVVLEERNGKWESCSVYCFIALQDYSTKALGTVKRGYVYKAASYKSPAKHARGSVFSPDFDNCATAFGVVYLK